MGESLQLTAQDGHQLDAYVSRPTGEIKGGVVVVQEIFGVNAYIRRVADNYAEEGYLAIAPALFDRAERSVELAYSGEDMQRAMSLYPRLDPTKAILDIAAAFQQLKAQTETVAVLGYCFGGLMAWLSATRGKDAGFAPSCTVGYYPGGIGGVAGEEPSCPVMLHFGAADTHIGPEQVDAVRKAHPEVQIFLYENAGHGFSCDARGSFNEEASALARQRTLSFLHEHVG